MTEFEFERGELLTNLTLLEDHAQKFPCPWCMEKHTSKIIGYAEEIAMGGEDTEVMTELAEQAREWRRTIQGAKEHSHETNPIPERCKFKVESVKPKGYFDASSFRTLCPECPEARCSKCPPEKECATRIIIGCKKGKFSAGKCTVGTEAHVIYHGYPK